VTPTDDDHVKTAWVLHLAGLPKEPNDT
jgi:hypothetical protein